MIQTRRQVFAGPEYYRIYLDGEATSPGGLCATGTRLGKFAGRSARVLEQQRELASIDRLPREIAPRAPLFYKFKEICRRRAVIHGNFWKAGIRLIKGCLPLLRPILVALGNGRMALSVVLA